MKLDFNHPKYFPVVCPECKWQGMSNETSGGEQTPGGDDYGDIVCPECIAPNGKHEEGRWIVVEELDNPNEK